MKKLFPNFIALAIELETVIILVFQSVLKTILKWSLLLLSTLTVLWLVFALIYNETYQVALATAGAAMIAIIYLVFMFTKLN